VRIATRSVAASAVSVPYTVFVPSNRFTVTHLTVTPSARGAGQIRHRYRPVRINLWVTYRPNGGHPRTTGFISLFVTK
jgi:hypothetical protein